MRYWYLKWGRDPSVSIPAGHRPPQGYSLMENSFFRWIPVIRCGLWEKLMWPLRGKCHLSFLYVVTLQKRGLHHLDYLEEYCHCVFYFSTNIHSLQFDVWSSSNSSILNKTCINSYMAIMCSCMGCVLHKGYLATRVSGSYTKSTS